MFVKLSSEMTGYVKQVVQLVAVTHWSDFWKIFEEKPKPKLK
jgi:hypothetical protein